MTCLTGLFPINTTCVPCDTNLVGCTECDVTGSMCTHCEDLGHWDLLSNKCSCQSGYYLNENLRRCLPCTVLDPLCTLCTGSMSIYECVSCSAGYFPINTTCTPCNANLKGCAECDIAGEICIQCNIANSWDLTNGTCTCPVGFY